MSQNPNRPIYSFEPIGSPAQLAVALRSTESGLMRLARRADKLYRLAKPIVKADGSIRQPYDAYPELKLVQRRLKDRILSKVEYPAYLTGSLKGRDYKTNAELHVGSRILICEDITNFFPSISSALVYDIWLGLFHFSPPVAELLTKLTTRCGVVPQGAIPSSYIANLALWRFEPGFQAALAQESIVYSRYVDDIAMSSRGVLSRPDQTRLVAQLYGMLAKVGLKAKRKKHESFSSSKRMITTKLVVNERVSLSDKQRANVRAAVHQLEKLAQPGECGPEFMRLLTSASVRVGNLGRFHPAEGARLKDKLRALRNGLPVEVPLTPPSGQPQSIDGVATSIFDQQPPPWD